MNVSLDSQPRKRSKGVPAKSLTSQGYAICFFPEQPIRKIIIEQDCGIGEGFVASVEELIEAKFVQQLETTVLPRRPELVRLHWKNRFSYFISYVSFTLSFNNFCHFPANVYNYETSFLFSYTVLMVFIGYPLHIMQVFLGQYCQQGLIQVFENAPVCYGISSSMFILSCLISTYYNVLAAYSLVYFSKSFVSPLAWTSCSDETLCNNKTLEARYYFYNVLLNTSNSGNDLNFGNIKWWLVLSNFYTWLIVYVVTVTGVRRIEKFAILVVTFSYLTILVLFGLSLTIKDLDHDNSLSNVNTSIINLKMWGVAAVQIVLELGLSYGVPICYGSYCHYRNWFHIDSLSLCAINYFNSIIFFIIFHKLTSFNDTEFSDLLLIIKNYGLAMVYIVFSSTLAQLDGGQFFCICFFLMLFYVLLARKLVLVKLCFVKFLICFHI